jgi:thiosulfate/3-mercaptopyruvate sulfurtransferase
MRSFRQWVPWALVTALLLLAQGAMAATRESLVVPVSWLAQHAKDADLVILHIGDKTGYAAAHIPAARYVDFSEDLATSEHTEKGLMLEMLPADVLRQRLAGLGISDHSRIVVYCDQGWISPATRVMFTLDYAGLGDRSVYLDGGLEAWVKAGQPVTKDVPKVEPASLSPLHIRPLVVDAAFVRDHLKSPGFAVVDGRAAVYYDGVEVPEMHDRKQRAGHIAGALSIPYSSINDEKFFLRSPEELAALFTKAGVKPGDTVIGYCHVGQQATEMLLAARTLGHTVLLYDGSFQDWDRRADYPVVNPQEKTQR